ncbi:hypothetical protein ACTG4Q_16620 [Bradyrhizobium denitrificans]
MPDIICIMSDIGMLPIIFILRSPIMLSDGVAAPVALPAPLAGASF